MQMLHAYVQPFLMIFVCVVSFCNAQNVVLPSITPTSGWFVDTTGRVSRSMLAQLHQEARQIEALGFQMAGAFFADTDRPGIDVATEFGNKNGIGFKDKDNGIAIAVFLDKKSASGLAPSISVAVGRGLEGLLNDAKVGRFLDTTFVSARKEERWEQGLVDFAAKVHRYLKDPKADEFKSDSRGNTDEDLERIIVIIELLITIIVLVIHSIVSGPRFPRGPRRPGGGGFGGSSGGGGSFGGGGASR